MALTEKDHSEIRRLTVLKMALDSRSETDTADHIVEKAKKFEDYVKGDEPDEKNREPRA